MILWLLVRKLVTCVTRDTPLISEPRCSPSLIIHMSSKAKKRKPEKATATKHEPPNVTSISIPEECVSHPESLTLDNPR